MAEAPPIVWFRLDLRVADNPALAAACERGGPVIPVYIHSPDEERPWEPGAASRWWLHQSLSALGTQLERLGAKLVIRRGPTLETLLDLIEESGARGVLWNRRYEPAVIRRDTQIKSSLEGRGIDAHSFNGSLLIEPWEVQTKQGAPYQVFTPYWRSCLARGFSAEHLSAPKRFVVPRKQVNSLLLDELELEPKIDWAAGMRAAWAPGEDGATKRLEAFLETAVDNYSEGRNLPAEPGSSRISPHLHFGEISVRTVWHRLAEIAKHRRADSKLKSIDTFRAELGWREFAHHLLYHFPETTDRPLRRAFENLPWEKNDAHLRAWQRGRTGFPIVDAGMRELWTTGWMHNRVRMIVASFLTKDLLIPWLEGAKWFWDTLVDADLASNTLGWQWTAGCGADAAPYFRVFNPTSQGLKFDPDGEYVRKWIPEIAALDDESIHDPWNVAPLLQKDVGIDLKQDYVRPLVDHANARQKALALYQEYVAGRK